LAQASRTHTHTHTFFCFLAHKIIVCVWGEKKRLRKRRDVDVPPGGRRVDDRDDSLCI